MTDPDTPQNRHSGADRLVDSDYIGEGWTPVEPGANPVLYGHAQISPQGRFEVRSYQTFALTYTVGRFGLDDTGAIRVVFRAMGDTGRLQTSDPAGDNYVTATASNGVTLSVHYAGRGMSARPRWKSLTVNVSNGYMREGDTITIVFGDTRYGSNGLKLQTMVETDFEFKVLADVCAVGHFVPIPDTPTIDIVPGSPVVWRAVLPSLRRPGERFHFGLKAEDKWGNPTPLAQEPFQFQSTLPVEGLPDTFDYPLGERAVSFDDLRVSEEGELRIAVVQRDTGDIVAQSHPMLIREGQHSGYWGDLHGQSGESIGIGTARSYFTFARDCAFLDLTSHQANDFQVNNKFWSYLNELSLEFLEEGRFVTFPGYEWSGNTAVGGDRNVYFRTEGRQIHRSSHALLPERDDIDTDAPNANLLFEALSDEDCVVYAHVGGRYADIAYAHDPRLERSMEIHSAWGTFEWMLTDGFALGHRSGVVCNSDGHKGRPGASYPGASMFGAYGGLTCFLAEALTRDAIFECLRRRHHYGTTGTRLCLDVRAELPTGGRRFDEDPNVFPDTNFDAVSQVMMGDIVQTEDHDVTLKVEVSAQGPIERIEIRNGLEVVETIRGFSQDDLGDRIRVVWSGAEYRGRGRETNWKGRVRFDGASIRRMDKINAWNHERKLEQHGSDAIIFDAITTGNFGGFDVGLDNAADAELSVETSLGSLNAPLSEIGIEDVVMDAGGLDRKIRAFRLPESNPHRAISARVKVPLKTGADNPLWVCVTTEDGFQAWSSPIYVFR
ncbi:MAG: DUF3604 domain-containing protein [Arenicellales bacterium]|nr:DUF3604 domain-containing protein [Arenicellales bacterium]MDP6530759.1 DUF3604 domain-containing protein [Arenicellales bacterium]MDP6855659.1 DUF3604 domain-containing protein [Arenicellales bacterium]